jgi:cytochrome c-type biogenesis protein CcmH/NrfG
MQRFDLLNGRSLGKFFLGFVLAVMLCLSGLVLQPQPSYAEVSSPKQALQEIKKDQAQEDPSEVYDEMRQVVENP